MYNPSLNLWRNICRFTRSWPVWAEQSGDLGGRFVRSKSHGTLSAEERQFLIAVQRGLKKNLTGLSE